MGRLFYWFVLALVLVVGSPYAALAVYRMMGPWSAVGYEADGTTTFTRFDHTIKPPAFVPLYPGAHVVQASLSHGGPVPGGFGLINLAVRAPAENVRGHFRDHLRAAGFEVVDWGVQGLTPGAAAFLGHAGMMIGKRPATDDVVVMQIGTESGWIWPSRNVQLSWRKLSDWPQHAPPP
jgi:hypothetical protein